MAGSSAPLTVFGLQHEHDIILRPRGVLDAASYGHLRDGILKAALEEPRSVIVNVDEMTVSSASCWTVFPAVSWQVNVWPKVPLIVVCQHPDLVDSLRRSGIARFITVVATEAHAQHAATVGASCTRRRVQMHLPPERDDARIRAFLDHALSAWNLRAQLAAASTVALELMDVVLDTVDGAGCALRLECVDEHRLTLAVTRFRRTPALPTVATEAPSAACRARLDQLHYPWGHAITTDRTTLWAIISTPTASPDDSV